MDAVNGERQNGDEERATRHASRATLHAQQPTLRVGTLPEVLALETLQTLSAEDLAAFLGQRRWFGAKAGAPRSARIRDVVRLTWEGGEFALARVEVVPALGSTALYQLPLCVRTLEEIGEDLPSSVVARVIATEGEEEGLLFDAVEDGAFLRALTEAMTKGASVTNEGSVGWRATPTSAVPLAIPADANIRVGSAEQSNTSVILDRLAIVKLFRTLQPGEHPDVEMTRYLTVDAEFQHTPVLLGVAEFTEADVAAVAGMMQEYLPESVDAWYFALETARPYFAAPAGREPANAFLDNAEHLGRVTRELHETLARGTTPAFAPERVSRERLTGWADGAREWITNGLALLEQQRAKTLAKERLAEAEALIRRRGHFVDSITRVVDQVANDAGAAMRIHGDYHLGQVLRTARDDFMIIDFEGEPLRSLEERRQKASPLRDVAGMLRSFAYAAATLGMEAKGVDTPTRELRAGRWERDSREAFLRGYLHEEHGAPTGRASRILPRDPAHVRLLLRLFETEKAFYELVYELNNRPDWVWIPMRGVAKLL